MHMAMICQIKVAQDNDSINGEAANPPPDNVEGLIKMVNTEQSSSSGSITDDQLHRSALTRKRLRINSQRSLASHLLLFTVSVPQRKTLVTWLSVSLAVSSPTVSALV